MEKNISDYRYDAFISYRHIPRDMAAAEALQKLLEKHRLPAVSDGGKSKRKLHIFRDQTELPTSGNLGEDIREALRESRYLIVVCSPDLKESRWCMEEIVYFKHLWNDSNSRILPLLVEGEPDDAFPEEIRWESRRVISKDGMESFSRVEIEPLGADIRANTERKRLHRLKTEYYRIAAPILGCRFDDLYRRAQRTRRRQIVTASAVIICCSLVFSAYSMYMLDQITERQQQLYETEALRLASDAQDKASSSNYLLSMLLAREALPKDLENPERPVIPEAEAALRSAVTQETVDMGKLPYLTRAVAPFNVATWWICRPYDEGRKVALTDFDKTYLYDTSNGRLIFSCDTEQVYFSENGERASQQLEWREKDKYTLYLDLYQTDSGEHYYSGTYETETSDDTLFNLFAIWDDDTDNCWVVKETISSSYDKRETVLLDRIDGEGNSHTGEELPEEILKLSKDYQYSYLGNENYISEKYDYTPDENGKTGNAEIDQLLEELAFAGYTSVRGVREMKDGELLVFSCNLFDSGGISYNGYQETSAAVIWSCKENRWLTILPGFVYEDQQSGLVYHRTMVELRVLSWLEDNFGIDGSSTEQYLLVSDDGKRYADVEEEGDSLYYSLWESGDLTEPVLRLPIKDYNAYYVTPDLSFVFLRTPDNKLQLWSADGTCQLELEPEFSSDTVCLTVDKDHKRLGVGSPISDTENQIQVYDAENGKKLQSFLLEDMGSYGLSHLEFEGETLLAASWSQSAVIDLTGEKETIYFEESNYGSRRDSALTSDGILFCTSETNVGNSLEAAYDLKTGKQILDYTSVFQYDETSGTLVYINYTGQSTISGSVYITHRKEDGTFGEPVEISSQNANMEFINGGQNLDNRFLLLNGKDCCEVYSTDTGEKLLELNSSGYALVNGLICDLQKNGSREALQFPVYSLEELYEKSEESLTSGSVTRTLNERERETYFITGN